MFFITLVSFALCVTAAKSKWPFSRKNHASLDPKSETNLQPQGEKRDHAIIFVSRTSGAQLGGKLLEEFYLSKKDFQTKEMELYDIQNKKDREDGLASACHFLQNGESNLIVAAAGGDGTVSWVVTLLEKYENNDGKACFVSLDSSEPKELNARIFIRHIGFGTGNDFAKSSGYTNEFNLFGEYKKTKRTWLDTLGNLNIRQYGDSLEHTMWEVQITAENITSVSAAGKKEVDNVEDVPGNKSMKLVKEKALLYLSGPFSGLMPCKVEQHRAERGKFISAANKNRLSYAEYGLKAFRKKSPLLKDYLTVSVDGVDKTTNKNFFPKGSQEFLLLLGKTFGGGKTPSTSKTLGDSKIEVLAAGGMLDLATMKFKDLGYAKRSLHMSFNSKMWEEKAKGFASKIEKIYEKREKQVYTIQKDGECRRLEGLTSLHIKPFIRFKVLRYAE